MRDRQLFVRFTKIDEEKREVAGRLTQEIVDRDGEIWDYAASVPHVKAWSKGFDDATDGKSVGNLRAMHQAISAGKLTSIEYNDADKAIDIVAKVVDDAEWEKTREGVYTGFSIGGNVVRTWRDPDQPKFKRFEVKPIEASLADLPCVPTATFSYVKLGGLVETRHFKKLLEEDAPREYADTASKRLPLFSKTMVKASMALWGHAAIRAPYEEKEQDAIGRRIRKAAEAHGIAVTEKSMLRGDFQKGLYDVSRLADLVASLGWLTQSAKYEREAEADDSPVPDQLTDAVAGLLETLEMMIGEEGDELLRMLGRDSSSTVTKEATAMTDDEKAAAAAASGTTTTQKVANADDFEKLTAKHKEVIGGIHTAMKAAHAMIGDACEKLAGFSGESSNKVATPETEKVAKSDFEKVVGERNDFEKRFNETSEKLTTVTAERDALANQAEELAAGVDTLTSALTVRKGALLSVDRGTGTATPVTPAAPVVEKVAAMTDPTEVDRTALHGSFKKAFQKPQIQNGLPGGAAAG